MYVSTEEWVHKVYEVQQRRSKIAYDLCIVYLIDKDGLHYSETVEELSQPDIQ